MTPTSMKRNSPVLNSALAPYRESIRRLSEDRDINVEKLSSVTNLLRQGGSNRALPEAEQENLQQAAKLLDRATQIYIVAKRMGAAGPNTLRQIRTYIDRVAIWLGAPPPSFVPVRTRRFSRRR